MKDGVKARYTLEFKREAVRLVHVGEKVSAVARTLDEGKVNRLWPEITLLRRQLRQLETSCDRTDSTVQCLPVGVLLS